MDSDSQVQVNKTRIKKVAKAAESEGEEEEEEEYDDEEEEEEDDLYELKVTDIKKKLQSEVLSF